MEGSGRWWRGAIAGGERSQVEEIGGRSLVEGSDRRRGAVSGGGEQLLVEGSSLGWRGAGERSLVEGCDRRWRGAVSGEGERLQVEGYN